VFWTRRGKLNPSLGRGTLKTLNEEYRELRKKDYHYAPIRLVLPAASLPSTIPVVGGAGKPEPEDADL